LQTAHIVANGKMTWIMKKILERTAVCAIEVMLQPLLEELRRTLKNLSKDSLWCGWYMNWPSPQPSVISGPTWFVTGGINAQVWEYWDGFDGRVADDEAGRYSEEKNM
jgi:hypothetical protein